MAIHEISVNEKEVVREKDLTSGIARTHNHFTQTCHKKSDEQTFAIQTPDDDDRSSKTQPPESLTQESLHRLSVG
jgi:hypothetical protein